MAKNSFSMDTIKNPPKDIDQDAAAAFISGADYTPAAKAPAAPAAPKKTDEEPPAPVAKEPVKAKKEKSPKEKDPKSLSDLKGAVEQPWESGSEQQMRNILVQISDASYKKLEYVVGHMGTRMSIRKFAIEAVQNRIEDELKKILKV